MRHWALGNRLAGDEDARRVGSRKDEPRGSGCGGVQVNRNGEKGEISVVYPMTTIFKLFVSLARQIHERLVHDGTLPWSNYCSGASAVPCGRLPAGFLSIGSSRRISSASNSDLAPQQNCCPIDDNGLRTTEIRVNFRNHKSISDCAYERASHTKS